MARLEVIELAALIDAIEAERRTQNVVARGRKTRTHTAVGRVLAMAHQVGRDTTSASQLATLKLSS